MDREVVQVPVTDALCAHFFEQFVKGSGTEAQKARKRTLMQLMAAAYRHGRARE